MSSIHYIVISYKSTLKNFLKLQKLSKNLMFVDNSGFQPSWHILQKLNLMRNDKNFGYGGAANVGIRNVLKYGAEWVVILNQDLQISKNGLRSLEKVIKKSRVGVLGVFAGGFVKTRWTTIFPFTDISYISGSCMAIHKDVINSIGYFYEPFFMYYEDADYCVRAKKAGFPLMASSIKGISHDDSFSLGKGSYLHEYYLARNHMLFIERQAPLSVRLYEYVRLPKTLYEHRKQNNKGAIDGIEDYFLRRFGEKQV